MDDKNRLSERAEERKLKSATTTTLWVAGVFAVALPAGYFVWWHFHAELPQNVTDPGAWGTFGDFVGGLLNPLVAFLALFWLTRSVQIQRTELRETRAALDEQSATLEKQRFEDTFFALLDQHNKVLDTLSDRKQSATGPLSEIERIHEATFRNDASLADSRATFMTFDMVIGHYFRILYQLFKLIATNTPGSTLGREFTPEALLVRLPSTEEKRYANIVRAFLGTHLTQLLAVNCYCASPASTYWPYKRLVERYSLLEHMPFKVECLSESVIARTNSWHSETVNSSLSLNRKLSRSVIRTGRISCRTTRSVL
jgi:hypothetical protein